MAYKANPAELRLAQRLRRMRSALRHLLSRIFMAPLYAELNELRARQDLLQSQLNLALARAYDQEALARRLAALEDALLEWREQIATTKDGMYPDVAAIAIRSR
jgi:hypothetical protein